MPMLGRVQRLEIMRGGNGSVLPCTCGVGEEPPVALPSVCHVRCVCIVYYIKLYTSNCRERFSTWQKADMHDLKFDVNSFEFEHRVLPSAKLQGSS